MADLFGKPELPDVSKALPRWTSTKHYWAAYRKGWEAPPGAECPYKDKRAGFLANIVTYSRAFRRYWIEGQADRKKGASRYA